MTNAASHNPSVRLQPLDVDAHCRMCGYNLRGLLPDGLCPECGTEIVWSLSRHELRGAGGWWLERVRSGTRNVLWAMFLAVGIMFILVIAYLFRISGLSTFAGIASLLIPLLYIGGVWELTSPDPRGLGERECAVSRRVARSASIVLFPQVLICIAFSDEIYSNSPRAALIVFGFTGITSAIASFALLHYIQKLALRIPDMIMSRKAAVLKFALNASWVVMLAGASSPTHGGCVFWLPVPFVFVFGCMFIGLLMALGVRLQSELMSSTTRAPTTRGADGST